MLHHEAVHRHRWRSSLTACQELDAGALRCSTFATSQPPPALTAAVSACRLVEELEKASKAEVRAGKLAMQAKQSK